jgi:serine/threonine protein kinase
MALTPDTKLGRYEIRSKLGEGGMGEVYLARDAQLGRDIALKILTADVARDPQRLHRFLQEARAAAALSHPNIAHIYEIGEADGAHFIAMEYVEGESLDKKIAGRPLRLSEQLDYAIQIADALDEAHARGIIHRDIKSSNIMVTARRGVKVLDFGLAKVSTPATFSRSGWSFMRWPRDGCRSAATPSLKPSIELPTLNPKRSAV